MTVRPPSQMSPTGHLVSVEEAADLLDTPVRFVRRLVAERRIPFHKVGKYVRIHTDDITAFVDAGRAEAVRPPRAWSGR